MILFLFLLSLLLVAAKLFVGASISWFLALLPAVLPLGVFALLSMFALLAAVFGLLFQRPARKGMKPSWTR